MAFTVDTSQLNKLSTDLGRTGVNATRKAAEAVRKSAAEVERALEALPGAVDVTEHSDLTAHFPGGVGVGAGGPVRDLRFGWVNGGARPEVPALFGKLAARL